MEQLFTNYLGELMVAAVLAVFGWAFKSWSSSIKTATSEILAGLTRLSAEFHQHRVDVERRVTRVETKVDMIHHDTKDYQKHE